MSHLEAYLDYRRRSAIRMWCGYALANAACIGAMAIIFYY